MANYNNHVKNNKMKNNYSKKLKFITINLMIIYYLLIIIISPNEVIGQSQQTSSNPTMAIPQMEWININSKYSPTNTVVPPGLKNFAFGYHADSKNIIIYGGSSSGGGVSGQTYMLDLNTMLWKNPQTTDPTKTGPDPRTRMLFGMDKWSSYRDQLVIFGGKGSGDIVYNDIWSFNVPYFTWSKISNISPNATFIPQMYDTLGGIDSTLAVFNSPNNTMWITHGTNGANFFTDAWAIGLGGSWAPGNNGLTANVVKVDMSSSSVIPSGRREAGGAILPNNRIVTYGGCNNTSSTECAIPETFSLQLNSDGVNPPAYSAKPSWAEQNRCLGSREEAAMVMVGKKPQDNLAVVFGGKAANGTGIGGDGEVGILDANLGTWVRILPKADPTYNVPKARAGARMLSTQTALLGSATDVVDILMYGGEALDGSSNYYNDLWILRLYTGILISQSTSNSTTPVKFLDCIVEEPSPTSVSPPSPTSSGTNELPTGKNGTNSTAPDEESFADAKVSYSHLLFSTIGYLLLLVSFSIVRFGYNSKFKLLIGISYALLLVSSCAIAFYGFSIAFIDAKDRPDPHFSSFHGLVGVILIVLLYILVPLLALILLFMTKSFDSSNNNNNNDEKLIKTIDHDNAYNANKGGFLNKLSAISNRNPFKKGSNDDYSDINGKSKTFEVTRQSLSIVKSVSDDNDWMEQRRSVSLADSHKAVNSFGSRNNSLQNNSSQNSDASLPGSRLGTGLGLSSSSNNFKTNIDNSDDSNHKKNNSSSSNVSHGNRSNIDDKPNGAVMITRHIFHIITQIILLLGAIYIAYDLGATEMLNRVYCIIFIALVVFVYLVWLFAAWLGYPKDRGSLLVSFAAKYCGGRDNYLPYSNEGDESDGEGKKEVTAVSPSPLNVKNVNSGNNDVDEDAEQDMRDREVVVMTIPKRRLAVVNV